MKFQDYLINNAFVPVGLLILVIIGYMLFANQKLELKTLDEEEVVKIYERYKQSKIEAKDDFCIRERPALKRVYSVGFFAHDLGCTGHEIVVGNKAGPWKELMPELLSVLGWELAEKREAIALSFVENIILAWQKVVKSSNKDFEKAGEEFSQPTVYFTNDLYRVELWFKEPGGMLPEANYCYYRVEITSEGALHHSQILKSLTVSYE